MPYAQQWTVSQTPENFEGRAKVVSSTSCNSIMMPSGGAIVVGPRIHKVSYKNCLQLHCRNAQTFARFRITCYYILKIQVPGFSPQVGITMESDYPPHQAMKPAKITRPSRMANSTAGSLVWIVASIVARGNFGIIYLLSLEI